MPDLLPATVQVVLRHMEAADLPIVVAVENARLTRRDEDFEEVVPHYAWTEKEIKAAISQRRDSEAGTFDTRAFVAIEKRITGAFIYELLPDGYHILLFTASTDAAREGMLGHLFQIGSRSAKRRLVTIDVPDGDYQTLKFFQDQKFEVKLGRRAFDGFTDAWSCSFQMPAKDFGMDLEMAGA